MAVVADTIRQFYGALVAASARRAAPGRARPKSARNGDYAALKRLVKDAGLLERQYVFYASKAAQIAALVAASAWWIAYFRQTTLVWLAVPIAALASGQIVMLGHDAAHHAVFASRRANEALALLLIGAGSGGSPSWWAHSHNEHHARSNDGDLDPDIDYPFLAFDEVRAAEIDPRFHPLVARQHWLAPMMMALVGLNLRVYGIAWLLRRGRGAEIAAALSFYVVYPPLVISALGLARGALFIALQQALFGLYLGLATSVNHWGMPMPRGRHGLDFVRHQVTTSRNIRGGAFADFLWGGLNRQAEHHLFPTMARNKLCEARPIVRAFCAERGIPYHEVSPIDAYREMFSALARVARTVGEPEREIVTLHQEP